jgi:hypothetical protein
MLSQPTKITNTTGLNAAAIAHHSDPMFNHAKLLGAELRREQLERSYEHIVLALASLLAISVGVIVWFWLNEQGVCVILDHGFAR